MKTIILTHWNRSLTWIVFCTSYVVIQSALGIDKRESFSSRDIVRFSTCNSKRNFGPKQQMCDAAYKDTKLDSITIHPSMPGVQVWTVPRTGEYSILALGAEGGRAIAPLHQSREAKQLAPYAMAYFHLSEGTKLNILIGQKGQDACSSGDCQISEGENVEENWGGGGGGGGTFIFMVDDNMNETIPLIIAGGGGGIGVGPFQKDPSVLYSDIDFTINGTNGNMSISGAGAGGGWSGETYSPLAGMSLLSGSIGGTGCPGPNGRHHAAGGFGGGGGACRGGGGGGGYKGGNGGSPLGSNGQDGSSYINRASTVYVFEPNLHSGDGEVEIYEYFPCACEEYCIVEDSVNRTYTCKCQNGKTLMPDEHTCSAAVSLTPQKENESNKQLILVLGSLASVIVIIISCCVYCVVRRRLHPVMLENCAVSKTTPNHLNRIVMQINESYTALSFSNPDMEINQIPREQIKCIRHIGRGAFGEVFQGIILPNNREQLPPKVAIKTLPAIYTEELEIDFVMEAVIMSKFEHPNIVKFLGVCFDNVRPHYIVLELLEGGSLKEFLFESRPKTNEPSRVSVLQMVKIATDIAKGCQYLEEQHFIHRDIAARNCLLTTKDPVGVAKIADFGMARDVYRSNYYRKTNRGLLPVKWMPPEAYLDGIFTSKSDVWAYGITLWEIFSMASDPYPGKVNQEVMQFVLDGGRLPSPENCPLSISYIMTCTWDSNPDVRPSFSTIVQKLQYCYEDPDTATYTLPTFTYNHSKVNFVELPDLHENSLSKRDAKKCSHPSLFSESLSEISEQHSSNRQINNDSNELSSCSDDIYKNSTKEGHQDISPEQCNRKGELLVPGIRSFINYLYMNQELPDPNNENTSQLDSRENSTENQADKNSDNNLLHSQHNHNHHLTTTSFPSPTPTPHTDHHHYHLQPQLQDSPRQSNPQSQQQSRSRSSSSSSSSSNNIKNHNNNSHNQQQPNMLELLQLDSLTKTSDFQNGEDKTNCRKQQQIQLQQQQQQQQHQQQQKQQQQQQELQLQQQQNLTEQEDDLNNKQQNEEPLQQQLEQLQETEEYDRYNADSFSLSPTKVPLLSSTDSDVSNYENDSFPKNSRCKSLRKSSQNSNYIPMRKVQDSPTESKYSNLDTNSI